MPDKNRSYLNHTGVSLAIILVITFFAFSNTFNNEFVMDDYDYIVDWPLIQDWGNLKKFFIGYTPLPTQPGIYSPIKTLIHAVNYHAFGLNPLGHHIAALLIHFLGTICVYAISLLLTKDKAAAFISGLLFGLHPVHVEAVTALTGSVDTFGVVLIFFSFWLYIKATQKDVLDRRSYAASLMLAFLGIFTHELTLAVPGLLFWYDFCYTRGRYALKSSLLRIAPYAGFVLFYTACKYWSLGSVSRGGYLYGSFYLTMLVVIKAFAKYVVICFFPKTLTHNQIIAPGIFSYDQSDFDQASVFLQSPFDLQTLASICLLSALAWAAFSNMKRRPLAAFCVGWFFISLLPAANIVPSSVYFAERYLYPASLGFCLLLAHYLAQLYRARRKWIAVLLALALVSGYFIRTYIRNTDWRDELVLHESAVRANPESALMRTDLGIIYSKFGEHEKALESFRKSLDINPDDPDTYFAMSGTLMELRYNSQAIEALHQAIALKSDFADAYYNLAGIYAFWGMKDLANENLKMARHYFIKQGRLEESALFMQAFYDYFSDIED